MVVSCCPCRFVARPRGNASAARDMAATAVTGPKNTLLCNCSHFHFRDHHFRYPIKYLQTLAILSNEFKYLQRCATSWWGYPRCERCEYPFKIPQISKYEIPKYQRFKILRTSKISLSQKTGIQVNAVNTELQ